MGGREGEGGRMGEINRKPKDLTLAPQSGVLAGRWRSQQPGSQCGRQQLIIRHSVCVCVGVVACSLLFHN